MTTKTTETRIRLIIDTDSYAGNFERQSVAYATGLVGDCNVGDQEAAQCDGVVPDDVLVWWEDHGAQLPDDNGCCRPAAIHPTPGFFNNGMGGHFPSTDEGRAQALVKLRESMAQQVAQQMERLDKVDPSKPEYQRGNWTLEAVARERKQYQDKLDAVMAQTTVPEYPAYMSVAVVVDEVPSQAILDLFVARMTEYLATKNVRVTGSGIETEEIVSTRVRRPMR